MNKPHTFIDLFSGAGGLSLGLRNAGFTELAACDVDEWSIETFCHNLGEAGHVRDLLSLQVDELRELAGLKPPEELSLLAGGPPCQGFSKQKRGAHNGDRRNALTLEYLRFVEGLQPQAFLLENVPMMAQVRGQRLVAEYFKLEDYSLTGHYYLAADYGLAQTRQRYVLAGVRSDVDGGFEVPTPTTAGELRRTVAETIADLPPPPSDYTDHPGYLNHQRARVTELNIERFSHVPPGGGWQDIPFDLRLECHKKVDTKTGGWPDVYGRLEWDGQCPTITGGFDSFTRGRYGHPDEDRPLTPREAARLQGFPDNFAFLGTRHDVRHQIGNAVPPPLAEALGRSVMGALTGTVAKVDEARALQLF